MIGALLLIGCQSAEFPAPVPGTAYRIEDDEPHHDQVTRIDVLATRKQCLEARIDDPACVPWADRASATVRLGFRLVDPRRNAELARSIRHDDLVVTHDDYEQAFQLVPHEPITPSHLYVVLVDGSASMFAGGGERIRAVHDALLQPSVVDAFYPSGSGTGVVLLRFTETVEGLDGRAPRVLTERDDYERVIRDHLLTPSRGYTHLYDAVEYVLDELPGVPGVAEFVEHRRAESTVVLLTDGFNNEAPYELCRDNVPRLEATVARLREARADPARAPLTLYTIGLGRPYRRRNKAPGLHRRIRDAELCGEHGDVRIDPTLERYGIDHLSLQWLAEAGGGRSVVQDDPGELPRVLREAAPQRFRWYELWIQAPDPVYHRSRFEIGLRLDQTSTTIGVLPHPWLDGPSGRVRAGSPFREPAPTRHVFAVLVPALAVLLLARFLGPAWFAARRLLFRGLRPRR